MSQSELVHSDEKKSISIIIAIVGTLWIVLDYLWKCGIEMNRMREIIVIGKVGEVTFPLEYRLAVFWSDWFFSAVAVVASTIGLAVLFRDLPERFPDLKKDRLDSVCNALAFIFFGVTIVHVMSIRYEMIFILKAIHVDSFWPITSFLAIAIIILLLFWKLKQFGRNAV